VLHSSHQDEHSLDHTCSSVGPNLFYSHHFNASKDDDVFIQKKNNNKKDDDA
jgi:hypothetical protein